MSYEIDTSELKFLSHWFRMQPRQYHRATAALLNNFAFGTRDKAIWLGYRRWTIRNPRFYESRFRVTKATAETQLATMGTVTARRFSAWTEQEYGAPTARRRVATVFARGGRKNQIKGRFRLKPARHVKTRSEYGIATDEQFAAAMLEQNAKGLIRIGKRVMTRQGKKLALVQTINPPRLQPKRRPFMATAQRMYFNSISIHALWYQTARRIVKPPKRLKRLF